MRTNAISIANYFVDKSKNEKFDITLLRLVKYVYISYGFGLSILDRTIIDERFDKVEAWKYGPVIPSVYHSFKYNGNKPITEKSIILSQEDNSGNVEFSTPEVDKSDNELLTLLDFVWDRYKNQTITELINILHGEGTPWKYCYRPNENVPIPDEMTKIYYDSIVENALKS